ncbi:HNH endonuclease [Exiguobacterium sp. s78]|uniref:HNH endonuclease n=1 Tax=Exiguobacterium sp. s78 TaxID=2751197 RepID=UPI001BEB51B6|nr:HNH endonuclease [Exiguobacterium sp. s78]
MLKFSSKFLIALLTVFLVVSTFESTNAFAATTSAATEDDECKKIVDDECMDVEYISDDQVNKEYVEFLDEDSVPDVPIDRVTADNFATLDEYRQWSRENPTAVKAARLGYLIPAAKALVTALSKQRKVVEQTLKSTKKKINVRNSKLAKKTHPVTGVPFNKKGFPEFPNKATVQLSLKEIKLSSPQQNKRCNQILLIQVQTNAKVSSRFTHAQLKQIKNSETPSGMTWHHHENTGVMQLVDKEVHRLTGHTGGKSIWGKL